ncbi:hypothetical protein [Deinococcus arcticus]|uniref:Uncharacterized protein n=1 Tax=Deinococcus arcticus TaxID=2136176 RepID=A0A2T3W7F0_9DEIO|nr:hypothetical protein [Deinococcus arcticus]PTA67737.1 hypothetical protein C8263_11550 [Deinococcus arcticus]
MPPLARQLLMALAAALLWVGIGLWQRTRGGTEVGAALLAELPLGAAVFGLALVWVRLRR